jgi:hypothetical protein
LAANKSANFKVDTSWDAADHPEIGAARRSPSYAQANVPAIFFYHFITPDYLSISQIKLTM